MVQASNASEFRAIVQELTGWKSNVGKISQNGGVATDDGSAPVDDLRTQENAGFRNDETEYSNIVALEFDERFQEFRPSREVSKSFGFEFPCVL
ncbi:hypothetical protein U1Q18_014887, partial [Sarracenia purpurea var. burkii]